MSQSTITHYHQGLKAIKDLAPEAIIQTDLFKSVDTVVDRASELAATSTKHYTLVIGLSLLATLGLSIAAARGMYWARGAKNIHRKKCVIGAVSTAAVAMWAIAENHKPNQALDIFSQYRTLSHQCANREKGDPTKTPIAQQRLEGDEERSKELADIKTIIIELLA